ncbi:hypothetical protein Tsubulata_051070 [Turnera subulata]|uniref:Uncharacterized protein n=1 Tax=Turnera subulata TaxID=218843 RepID=A0A9Q0JA58_9ROSI|nr:hypothetical protein Tsubulata_051070 [Turnera subulata]
MDGTVKVWDMETLGCRQSLKAHDNAVMSLLCLGDGYLVSASLDNTLKVWALTAKDGSFEFIHTHKEQHGILKLCGMLDSHGKPVLLCSCNASACTTWNLSPIVPQFSPPKKSGRFSLVPVASSSPVMQPVSSQYGNGSDATGVITIWQWLP